MSLSTIRSAIKTKMEGIGSVANVDDYVVWTNDWDYILANWTTSDKRIHRWHVGLAAPMVVERPMPGGLQAWQYNFVITGIYSLLTSIESSKDFEVIVEDVMAEFSKSNSFLAGTTIAGIQLTSYESTVHPATETPVHRAVFNLTINEVRAVTKLCSG